MLSWVYFFYQFSAIPASLVHFILIHPVFDEMTLKHGFTLTLNYLKL